MVAGSAKAPQGLVVAAKNALAGPLPEVVQPDCTSKPLGPLDNEHPNAHDYAELGIICTHLDGTSTAPRPSRRPRSLPPEPQIAFRGTQAFRVSAQGNMRPAKALKLCKQLWRPKCDP
jgi:hypothetical protein